MFGYSPAAFRESSITNFTIIHENFPSGGLDGLSDKWHVSFANALIALTMIVCAYVEILVVFPVVPTDILLFILYAGVVGIG